MCTNLYQAMSRHFPWWPWHTIVCRPPCVEVSRGGQQVGMKTARHTVGCQGHQNTQSDVKVIKTQLDVKVIKTHSQMSRSSKTQSDVKVIKTHSQMSRSSKHTVRCQGHQNIQSDVKVIKTQSNVKVIKTHSLMSMSPKQHKLSCTYNQTQTVL